MENIPKDIIPHILLHLPAISIFRFKCVCKDWKHLFESFNFIENHIPRSLRQNSIYSSLILTCNSSLYLIDYHDQNPSPRPRELALPRDYETEDRVRVVGSCNGLLCIAIGRFLNQYVVCNPYYPESFTLLPFAHNLLSQYQSEDWRPQVQPLIITGFGYDHLSDDYKIVYAWWNKDFSEEGWYKDDLLLYSKRADSWRKVEEHPQFRGLWGTTEGVLVNSCLHWSISRFHDSVIHSFDLHTEEWCELGLPERKNHYYVDHIYVFKGCLSAFLKVKDCSELEFWVMKEYGVEYSWTRLFNVPNRTELVIHYAIRPRHVLLTHRDDDGHHCLSWFSPKEKKIVQRVGIQDDLVVDGVKSFVGSLALPRTKGHGENEEKNEIIEKLSEEEEEEAEV